MSLTVPFYQATSVWLADQPRMPYRIAPVLLVKPQVTLDQQALYRAYLQATWIPVLSNDLRSGIIRAHDSHALLLMNAQKSSAMAQQPLVY